MSSLDIQDLRRDWVLAKASILWEEDLDIDEIYQRMREDFLALKLPGICVFDITRSEAVVTCGGSSLCFKIYSERDTTFFVDGYRLSLWPIDLVGKLASRFPKEVRGGKPFTRLQTLEVATKELARVEATFRDLSWLNLAPEWSQGVPLCDQWGIRAACSAVGSSLHNPRGWVPCLKRSPRGSQPAPDMSIIRPPAPLRTGVGRPRSISQTPQGWNKETFLSSEYIAKRFGSEVGVAFNRIPLKGHKPPAQLLKWTVQGTGYGFLFLPSDSATTLTADLWDAFDSTTHYRFLVSDLQLSTSEELSRPGKSFVVDRPSALQDPTSPFYPLPQGLYKDKLTKDTPHPMWEDGDIRI